MAHKVTKMLQFNKDTALKITERDGMCFFCRQGYHMESLYALDYQIQDIMHIVPKSSLGLGIEQNGVLGCRYHHSLMDNGNKGLRTEMLGMLEEYLKSLYGGWTKESVTYKKYNFGVKL